MSEHTKPGSGADSSWALLFILLAFWALAAAGEHRAVEIAVEDARAEWCSELDIRIYHPHC